MRRSVPTSLLMFLAYRAAEDRILENLAEAGYADITRAQARLLAGIDLAGTRLVVLADRARIAKQTALALVNSLVAAGYVERVPDPSDGRARLIRLTAPGLGILPHAIAAEEAIDAEWSEHLGRSRMDQLREALDLLRQITDPASAEVTDPASAEVTDPASAEVTEERPPATRSYWRSGSPAGA